MDNAPHAGRYPYLTLSGNGGRVGTMTTSPNAAREQLTKLAVALYRFSQSLDSSFAAHLKQLAVELAGALETGEKEAVAGILAKARGVVALGERVGAIAASDVQVIAAAIARSQTMALPNPAKKEVSVDVFAELAQGQASEAPAAPKAEVSQPREESPVAAPQHRPQASSTQPIQASLGRVTVTAIASPSAADRQGRIVAAIRQNPNARMRDLLAALPGVSERTIRYDLERLVSSGTIEREGVGGPATWYRLREGVTR